MRVLLVEDDDKIGSFVAKGLTQEGHVVDWSRTGDDGLAQLGATEYNAAVVDVMLPGLNGLDLIRAARTRHIGTPVIVLSARDAVGDRVAGLDAGADDYLTKPFSFAELIARLHALVRRASTGAGSSPRLSYGGVS